MKQSGNYILGAPGQPMWKAIQVDLRTFLWSLLGSVVFAWLATWYQGVLKDQVAKIHLDPVAAAVASLPTWAALVSFLVIGLLVAAGGVSLWGFLVKASRRQIAISEPASQSFSAEIANLTGKIDARTQQRDAAQVQRDDYKFQRDEYKRQLDDRKRNDVENT